MEICRKLRFLIDDWQLIGYTDEGLGYQRGQAVKAVPRTSCAVLSMLGTRHILCSGLSTNHWARSTCSRPVPLCPGRWKDPSQKADFQSSQSPSPPGDSQGVRCGTAVRMAEFWTGLVVTGARHLRESYWLSVHFLEWSRLNMTVVWFNKTLQSLYYEDIRIRNSL